ncbi:MAG: hypothetical protein JWO19_2863 [Bryobacterales bacterium]|nr:hypothetical protein [Bryobacterales bacterium]
MRLAVCRSPDPRYRRRYTRAVRVPLRTTIVFFTAYALNTLAHEFAHALMAYSLGLRSTVFHYYADIDFTGAEAYPRILVPLAGPLFSLGFGLVCWLVYRKTRSKPSKLPWLYLAIFGISIFLGNVFSTSSAGDFGTVATIMNVSPTSRLLIAISGMLLAGAFMYSMGQELVKWAPPGSGRTMAMVHMVVLPALLGTGLAILAFLPMPAQFIVGWIATSFFWLFAAGGAYFAPEHATGGGDLRTRPIEYAAAAVVLATVRILVIGVRITP